MSTSMASTSSSPSAWTWAGKDSSVMDSQSAPHHVLQSPFRGDQHFVVPEEHSPNASSPSDSLMMTPKFYSEYSNHSSPSTPYSPQKNPPSSVKKNRTRAHGRNSPSLPHHKRLTPPGNKPLAARERPLFDKASLQADNHPSTSAPLAAKKSNARRQLMPTIPTRRDSAIQGTTSGSSSPQLAAAISHGSNNQTNIQSLAQAIAARAQHVAATKVGSLDAKSDASYSLRSTSSRQSFLSKSDRSEGVDSSSETEKHPGDDTNEDVTTPRPAEAALTADRGALNKDVRASVADSFRWSQGDWAEYAAILSHQIDIGATDDPPSEQSPSDAHDHSANLSGLGIGMAEMPKAGVEKEESNADTLADGEASFADSDIDHTSPLLAQIGKTLSTPDQQFPATPSTAATDSPIGMNGAAFEPSPTQRKPRPHALTLSAVDTSARSPTRARALNSPSVGGRTPPPTMPPSEPLPPLPADAFTVKKWSYSSDPSQPGSLTKVLLNGRAEEETAEPRRSSDPLVQGAFGQAEQLTHSNSQPIHLGNNSLSARSAAMVQAHNASTLAESHRAQSLLDQVRPVPTFNETAQTVQPAHSSVTSITQSSSDEDAIKTLPDEDTIKSLPEEHAIKTLPEEHAIKTLPEEEEDALSDEEAVITSVTGTRNSVSKTPTFVRGESNPLLSTLGKHPSRDRSYSHESSNAKTDAGYKPDDDAGNSHVSGRPSLVNAPQPQKVHLQTSSDNSCGPRSQSQTSVYGMTGDWTPSAETPTLSVYDHPDGDYGSESGASHVPTMQRRISIQERSDGTNSQGGSSTRAKAPLHTGNGSFRDIATAFKQLQAEKRALEKIVRATTPLDGLGNSDSLAEYLTSTSSKLDMSAREMHKLLDLLDQQRSVMDYMVDTHQLEMDAHVDELDELKEDYEALSIEAETHRMNAIRLTEDLDKAHNDAIVARAEALRYKASIADEESRREKALTLLRQARDDLMRLENERTKAQQSERHSKEDHAREIHNLKHEIDRLRAFSATSVDEDAQARNLSSTSTSSERISELEKELLHTKALNAELEKQVHSLSRRPSSDADHSTSRFSDEDDAEKEILRDKLVQQEKDISDLRAAIALGPNAAAHQDGPANSASVTHTDRADQIKALMKQMSEQRAREAQIRTAYRQLRDDLRKMQSMQSHDRKRNQTAFTLLSHPAAPSSSNGHGSVHEEDGPSHPTPRHLKRLSLPQVNRVAVPLQNNSPSSSLPTTERPASVDVHASYTPSPRSRRRASRTFSVDFASAVSTLQRDETSGRVSPRSAALKTLSGAHSSSDDDDPMEQLSSPLNTT